MYGGCETPAVRRGNVMQIRKVGLTVWLFVLKLDHLFAALDAPPASAIKPNVRRFTDRGERARAAGLACEHCQSYVCR